jgi:hypothetical protein
MTPVDLLMQNGPKLIPCCRAGGCVLPAASATTAVAKNAAIAIASTLRNMHFLLL